jgi:hypothetical protein
MKAKTRRKIEMGQRALKFSRAHPDASPGYAAALARLEDRLTRAEEVAEQQREGILHVRAATVRKRDLRRTIKLTHLDHLASVAQVAAHEVPELAQLFTLPRQANPYLAFRTAARGLAAEAESRKELLVKHGLTDTVLTGLAQALNEFDAAVDQGAEGHSAHVGASAELDAVGNEIVQVVNVMAGTNRSRFAHDPELLASWESVSSVLATPRVDAKPTTGAIPPASGDVRPAA